MSKMRSNLQEQGHVSSLLGFPVWLTEEEQFRFVAYDTESTVKEGLTMLNFKIGLKVTPSKLPDGRVQLEEVQQSEEEKTQARAFSLSQLYPGERHYE